MTTATNDARKRKPKSQNVSSSDFESDFERSVHIDTKDSANLEDVDGDAEWIFRVALFSEGKCEEQ